MKNTRSAQSSLGLMGSVLFVAIIVFLVISHVPLESRSLIVIAAPIVLAITFVNTDLALIILILSMLLSPGIDVGQVSSRAVAIRMDDVLILVIFFSWLAKIAINKQMSLLKQTSLNLPITVYISVCIVCTALGLLSSRGSLLRSFFYLLKYVEYFMIYFMVSNNLRDKKQIKIFTVFILITCALTCLYALTHAGANEGRASTPFQNQGGEPNTLGGYLVFIFAIVSGLFLYSRSLVWRCACVALAGLALFTLFHTLSRGSYVAFIFMILGLVVLTGKKRILLMGVLVFGALIFSFMRPAVVTNRINETFTRGGTTYKPFGMRIVLDESASARVDIWREVFKRAKKRPFFGYGISALGIVDSQYPLVLGETGIIGLWIFIWLMIRIFRSGLQVYRVEEDDWEKGLALGFLAGFIGLLVHSFDAATFILERIMGPFWFLAAMVMMLPQFENLPEQPERTTLKHV